MFIVKIGLAKKHEITITDNILLPILTRHRACRIILSGSALRV